MPVAQVPYQQPQQQDSFDQLGKVVDLIDKLNQRSANAPAPGSSQFGALNAAQFQGADMQKLWMQEMLLRNPQLLSQMQQGQLQTPQPAQTQQQETTYSQQQVAQLKQQFDVAVNCANQHFNQLQQLWQMTQQIMNCYNAVCEYAAELERVAALGQASNIHANAFLNELNAAYEMLNVQHFMLTNPLYLLSHSFSTFDNEIAADDDAAVNLVSDFYLNFVKNFEEKRRQYLGGYSPQYTEYLQAQVQVQQPNYQTQQPTQAPQYIDSVVAWANGLRSEGFAQNLKRAHTQRMIG